MRANAVRLPNQYRFKGRTIFVVLVFIFALRHIKSYKFHRYCHLPFLRRNLLKFKKTNEVFTAQVLITEKPFKIIKECNFDLSGTSEVLVVTYASPKCIHCNEAFKQLQHYCEIHAYKCLLFKNVLIPKGLNTKWTKIFILQDLLLKSTSTIIVWIDLDVLIVDLRQSLGFFISLLEKKFDLLIPHNSAFYDHWSLLSAGIYIVKNTFSMKFFFKNAVKLTKFSTLSKQNTFKPSVLLYSLTHFVQQKTLFIPTNLMQIHCSKCNTNTIKRLHAKSPFAINFAGVAPYQKQKLISSLLELIADKTIN